MCQPLWFNSFIRVNDEVVFNRHLFDTGMIYLKDICNNNGFFLSYNEVLNKFGDVPYLQYYSLISAIPAQWKTVFKGNSLENITEPVNEKFAKFLQSTRTTKFCYNIFVKKYITSISETNLKDKWQKDVDENLSDMQDWNSSFALIYKTSIDTSLRNFQFKFLHRKITTNEFLYKIGVKSSPMCSFCDNHIQTISHLFWKCTFVASFWKDLIEWLYKKGIYIEHLSDSDIFFGVKSSNNFLLLNTVILRAKKFVFSCNYLSKRPSFSIFKHEIYRVEKIERCIALKKNTLSVHKKKWSALICT